MNFTPNVTVANGDGYYVGMDENAVRDKCNTEANFGKYAHNLSCAG